MSMNSWKVSVYKHAVSLKTVYNFELFFLYNFNRSGYSGKWTQHEVLTGIWRMP